MFAINKGEFKRCIFSIPDGLRIKAILLLFMLIDVNSHTPDVLGLSSPAWTKIQHSHGHSHVGMTTAWSAACCCRKLRNACVLVVPLMCLCRQV